MPADALTVEHEDPQAELLVITNAWPHPSDPPGGIFVKRQVDSLIAGGVRCDVLFLRGYRSLWTYPAAALELLLANVTPKKRYRLVHCHGGEAALAARCYLRAPLLVTYYGSDLQGVVRAGPSVPLRSRVRRTLIRQHARLARATITQSARMEACLPAGIRGRNVVLPNGVDSNVFRPIDRDEARRELGWPVHERVVLFAGSTRKPVKRYALAEAACLRAAKTLPDVRLHVASSVPPEGMPIVMSASDCLLLTSVSEGSPNVFKEAVMCILPVVSTEVGDVPRVLERVEPSWLAEPSEHDVARALVECLREPRRSNGREVSGWLTVEAIQETVLDLYEALAPGITGRARHAAGEGEAASDRAARSASAV